MPLTTIIKNPNTHRTNNILKTISIFLLLLIIITITITIIMILLLLWLSIINSIMKSKVKKKCGVLKFY